MLRSVRRSCGVPLMLASVLAACGGVEGDGKAGIMDQEPVMPTLTVSAKSEGGVDIETSPDFRPGIYPYRLITRDANGKTIAESVRTGPRVIDPPSPEAEQELRDFLATDDGKEFLDWLGSAR